MKLNFKNHKINTVAKFEIIRQLKKPSFWISLFAIPAVIVGIWGLSFLNSSNLEQEIKKAGSGKVEKIGITDKLNIINPKILKSLHQNQPDSAKIYFYQNPKEGIEKIQSGELDLYYHISANFIKDGKIILYQKSSPEKSLLSSGGNTSPLKVLLSQAVSLTTTPLEQRILSNNYSFETNIINSAGENDNLLGRAIIPGAILLIFYFMIAVFGNRMLMAVVEEKENRVSEMLLSAVSARDLIVGKILALISLGFIQITVFILPIICLILFNLQNPAISGILANLEFHPSIFLANLALLFFSYFLYTGFSVFVGSISPSARDASQYIGIIVMGFMAPLFFLNSIMSETPNTITYILSYFPLSSPITLMLRNTIGSLPIQELLIGLVEITLLSILVVFLAIRSFQKNAINFEAKKFSFNPRNLWK